MDFWTWVIVILVGAVVIAVIQAIDTSNKKKAMDDHLGSIKDFSATQKVMGSDGNTGLAIDEQRKKICLIDHKQQNVTTRVFGTSGTLIRCYKFTSNASSSEKHPPYLRKQINQFIDRHAGFCFCTYSLTGTKTQVRSYRVVFSFFEVSMMIRVSGFWGATSGTSYSEKSKCNIFIRA
jgi:hypothetical protein